MLLAWLFAGAHVAMEHGGEELGEAMHGAHHHDDDDAPGDGNHHHHDLGPTTAAQFTKSAGQQILAPQWVPIYDRFLAGVAALLRKMETIHEHPIVCDSPPDERASGWLLLCQTALPVRGPSLAV